MAESTPCEMLQLVASISISHVFSFCRRRSKAIALWSETRELLESFRLRTLSVLRPCGAWGRSKSTNDLQASSPNPQPSMHRLSICSTTQLVEVETVEAEAFWDSLVPCVRTCEKASTPASSRRLYERTSRYILRCCTTSSPTELIPEP